jgi:hypothetical protein
MTRKVMFFGAMLLGFVIHAQTVMNLQRPVSITTTNAQSSQNPADYSWQNPSNNLQGITIYVPPATQPNTPPIFMQQNNGRFSFSIAYSGQAFYKIELSYDNAPYSTIFEATGSTLPKEYHGWITPPSSFTTFGGHTLKVKYQNTIGNTYTRNYDVYVVEDCDGFYMDNVTAGTTDFYRNKLTLWEGSNPSNQKAVLLVSGFNAYNTLPAEYYRFAGTNLFQEFLDNNYKVYVLTFAFNAQDLKSNAAVVHSAVEYISSLNNNNDIILAGMSMGGVITRYTLAKDEQTQNNLGTINYLPVSHYISLDAPQQGAILSTELMQFTHANDENNYTFNTNAFKFMVRNNTKSIHAQLHNSFYAELNNLNNGLGYPTHCLNVGIAFSKPTLYNPHAGQKWLEIDANAHTGGALLFNVGSKSHDDYVNNEETHPGSHLPISTGAANDLRTGWGLINVVTNRSQDYHPTFISHNSALDINNGVSKFCLTLFPENQTSLLAHDYIPPEIIKPLIDILETGNLSSIPAGVAYNFTKNTPKHILENIEVYGSLLVNNNSSSGFSNNPIGGAPTGGSVNTVSTNACQGVTININNGAALEVGDLSGHSTGIFKLKKGSTLALKAGSSLKVADNSKIVIEDGANFIFEEGASIELLGSNAELVIKGKVTVGDNSTLTFTGQGHFVIDQFIYDGVYDNFWNIGQNAKLELIGSSLRTLLECKSNFVPKMQNQHTFAQIKIRNGIVSMHPNTSISTHAPLDLYMLTMKLASGYQPSALHNGLQLWGQNASIVQCTFKNATIGINSEQSLATTPLSLVNCWFLDNEIGLQTRGKNAVVQSSVFNNNTNGGWQALQMSGTSRVENSTFNNPGAIGGVYFEGQQGATLLALGNTFTNSETGIFVETATLTPTCNTFANLTYQGIFCLESNLYLNEEKFNLFNNNQSGITIQNSNGGNAFFMEQGFNEFVLGNAGYNHLNGYFGPGSILNMPTSTQIDADNNKMEIISIGNYSGPPVDIDLGLIPFGATPLSLHIPSNLSAVSSNCSGGSGVGAVLEEERTLQSLSSFKTINTTHYQNVNLQVALLDAVGEVSTDMFEGQDLLAISKLFEILTYNLGATTTDEAAMLEIGYKVMIKALNFSFAYGNLQLNRAEPSTFIDAYTEKIISVITSRLSNLNTLSATFEAERFRLNLDMSHVYRLAEYYDHAIVHLQTSSGWAIHMQQQQNANYW